MWAYGSALRKSLARIIHESLSNTTPQQTQITFASSRLGTGAFTVNFSLIGSAIMPDVDVTPDPRNTSVGNVTVNFDKAVTNVDITDFILTRDGLAVDISGLTVSQIDPQ